jgi:hypothetical protein
MIWVGEGGVFLAVQREERVEREMGGSVAVSAEMGREDGKGWAPTRYKRRVGLLYSIYMY